MIEIINRVALSREESEAISRLLSACEAFDGVAALEMEKSLNARKDMPSFFLAYEEKALVGALSVFAPMSDEAELGALVLPSARRSGVFSSLFTAAEKELGRFGYASELFVIDGRSEAGKEAAASLAARYEYTEYAMRYEGGSLPEREGRASSSLVISRLGEESIGVLADLRAAAFEGSREDAESFERSTFASANRRVYGAFLKSELVGACSLGFEGRTVSINGLVVAEARRGEGLGQAFLSRIVAILLADGCEILLDVNSENAGAFHIYKKLGFAVLRSVEYHRRSVM